MSWANIPLQKIVFQAPEGFIICDMGLTKEKALIVLCYSESQDSYKRFITQNGIDFAEIIE